MKQRIFTATIGVVLLFCSSVLLFAQPFEGRVIMKTDHFEFIYEPQDTWAVQEILQISDRVYETLAEMLDHRPNRPIPVILTSRPVVSNGYYSPFPARIVLFTTNSANRFLGSRTASWIQSLFIHELTHYFHLTAPLGPARFLSPIFGPDVPAMNTVVMPGWWIEGITTYTETHLAPGGRGENPLFDLTYEAPLLEGSMWSLGKGSYNSLNPPTGRIYTTGYLMVEHLMQTYGEDTFARINARYVQWPFFGMRSAFTSVVGKTPSEVYSDALDEIRSELPGGSPAYPLFSPALQGNFYLPYHSEAGIVGFANTHGEGHHVRIYDDESQTRLPLPPLAPSGPLNGTITAAGETLYLTSAWGDPYDKASIPMAPVSYSDVYRYDGESGTFTRLTHRQRLTQPAVSPDGSRLVAIQSHEDRWRLVSVDTETGELTVLHDREAGNVFEPHFSPDGETLIFIENVEGLSTLAMLDAQGTVSTLWEHEPVEIRNPRFVDERRVWFASDGMGPLALFETEVVDGSRYRILSDGFGITGAIQLNDRVVYETYTAHGVALRDAPLGALTRVPVPPVDMPAGTLRIEPTNRGLESNVYRDLPRFNLWLPFAMNIPEFVAGATVIGRSALGMHTVQASGGWSFQADQPVFDLTYQYNPGTWLLTVTGQVNQQVREDRYRSMASISSRFPLGRKVLPTYTETVHSHWNAQFIHEQEQYFGGGTSLSWERRRHARPKDFFGNSFIGTAGGISATYHVNEARVGPTASWSFWGQLPILRTHQVLRLDISAGMSLGEDLVSGVAPMGFDYPVNWGRASSLFSLRWRIPFGIIDQPVPYGGITGMGLTIQGQTLVRSMRDDSLLWKDQIYLGALLHANFAIGGTFTLQTFGGVIFRVPDSQIRFVFGLDFHSLFASDTSVGSSLGSYH